MIRRLKRVGWLIRDYHDLTRERFISVVLKIMLWFQEWGNR